MKPYFNNYTRDQIVRSMEKLGKPSHESKVVGVWINISDTVKIKEVESIKTGMGFNEHDAMLMAFRAAVVDLIDQKVMCHDAEGMLCLTEWLPDPKRLRSLDDGWAT